jgi:hypothetical protein
MYSQAFNGPEILNFGNEVNLTSAGSISAATVSMTQFATAGVPTGTEIAANCSADIAAQYQWPTGVTPTCYNAEIGLAFFNPGSTPGSVGSEITSTATTVEVPYGTLNYTFNVTFTISPPVALPSTVVYGISLPQLATDGQALGNDPTPIGSLNVNLSSEGYDVTAGSDVYPGNVFISSDQTDTTGEALATNLGACPNAPTGSLAQLQAIPVMCPAGYGSSTANNTGFQSGGLWENNIPAVAFYTATGLPPTGAPPAVAAG